MELHFNLNVQGELIKASLSPITLFAKEAMLFLTMHMHQEHSVNEVISHIFQITGKKWKIQPSMHHLDNDQEKMHLYFSLKGRNEELEKITKTFIAHTVS